MGISKPIDDVIFDFKHIIRGGTKMVIGSVETLIQLARDNNSSIGQAMVKQEAQRQQITEADVLEQMKKKRHDVKKLAIAQDITLKTRPNNI